MSGLDRLIRGIALIAGIAVIGYGLTLPISGSQGRWLACLAIGGLLTAIALWPRTSEFDDPENRPVINVIAAIAFVFGLVAIQLARMQALSASKISERSGVDPASGDVLSNPRAVNLDLVVARGAIVDRNGVVLAESVKRGGIFTRRYPVQEASYICGYFSPLKYGTAGLEQRFDDRLSGIDVGNPIETEIDRLLDRAQRGAHLELSVDVDLQRQAQGLLEGFIGAIVLIEVDTGAVLALASKPHFDPSLLVAVDGNSAKTASDYWAELNDDRSQPLLIRATDGLYTPGSTFKTITAAAAIDTGTAEPRDVYTDNGELDVDGHLIEERNRPDNSINEWTLAQGLAFSLNVVFAQIGLELGADRLRDYAERFGFGAEIPFDVPVTTGQVATDPDFLESAAALADTAFGQGQLLTTPLGMALVTSAIANHGAMMRPFLVRRVIGPDGNELSTIGSEVWRRPVSPETADTVRDLMINTVENGYAASAAIPGFTVGGKSGTAESGTEKPHAWFIGFIGDPNPTLAVAVVIEHGGSGTQGPLLMAREMLATAMGAS